MCGRLGASLRGWGVWLGRREVDNGRTGLVVVSEELVLTLLRVAVPKLGGNNESGSCLLGPGVATGKAVYIAYRDTEGAG